MLIAAMLADAFSLFYAITPAWHCFLYFHYRHATDCLIFWCRWTNFSSPAYWYAPAFFMTSPIIFATVYFAFTPPFTPFFGQYKTQQQRRRRRRFTMDFCHVVTPLIRRLSIRRRQCWIIIWFHYDISSPPDLASFLLRLSPRRL